MPSSCEREREQAMPTATAAVPITAVVVSSGCDSPLDGQERRRPRRRRRTLAKRVPDRRRGGADRHLLDREAPAPQHRVRQRHAHGVASRQDARGGRRGLGDHERVHGSRGPGSAAIQGGPKVARLRARPRRARRRPGAEAGDGIPDLAVVGDARQHDGEHADHERRARRRGRRSLSRARDGWPWGDDTAGGSPPFGAITDQSTPNRFLTPSQLAAQTPRLTRRESALSAADELEFPREGHA